MQLPGLMPSCEEEEGTSVEDVSLARSQPPPLWGRGLPRKWASVNPLALSSTRGLHVSDVPLLLI